jgi:hypothetical protein
MFSSFLDSYLKFFYSSFPLKRVHIDKKNKNWITLGILTSPASRNSDNSDLIKHYRRDCKILSAVIKEAKILNYPNKITKSLNKNKTIWDTVNLETNKTGNTEKINNLYRVIQ